MKKKLFQKKILIITLSLILIIGLLGSGIPKPIADTQAIYVLGSKGSDGKFNTSDDIYVTMNGDVVKGPIKVDMTNAIPSAGDNTSQKNISNTSNLNPTSDTTYVIPDGGSFEILGYNHIHYLIRDVYTYYKNIYTVDGLYVHVTKYFDPTSYSSPTDNYNLSNVENYDFATPPSGATSLVFSVEYYSSSNSYCPIASYYDSQGNLISYTSSGSPSVVLSASIVYPYVSINP